MCIWVRLFSLRNRPSIKQPPRDNKSRNNDVVGFKMILNMGFSMATNVSIYTATNLRITLTTNVRIDMTIIVQLVGIGDRKGGGSSNWWRNANLSGPITK